MTNLTLKVEDILSLNAETTAFLREQINLGLKYKLTTFLKKLGEYVKPALEQRDDIIRELAPDGMNIKMKLEDGTENPAIKEFEAKYKEVTSVEVTFNDVPEIEATVLSNIVSTNNYPLIYKFLLKEA